MRDISEITEVKNEITKLISRSSLGVFNKAVYDKIEGLEFKLQELWGLKKDPKKHRSKEFYKFKCTWVGRRFKCVKIGEILDIPETVTYRSFFEFGECFIDVGDGYYSRFGGEIEEIKD